MPTGHWSPMHCISAAVKTAKAVFGVEENAANRKKLRSTTVAFVLKACCIK
jgi:hypothetical protein